MPTDLLRRLLVDAIQPPRGAKLWHGAPSAHGALRMVKPEEALWRPGLRRKCIWELALHIAYWRYAVRQHLAPDGDGFPYSPAGWPRIPDPSDKHAWERTRVWVEHEGIVLATAVERLPESHFDRISPIGKTYTRAQLVMGIVQHDAHHVGQIQLIKKLMKER